MKRVKLTLWAFTPKASCGLSKIFSYLVCFWTRSKWDHIGFSTDEKYFEATPFVGVRSYPTTRRDAVFIHSWDVITTPEKEQWLEDQLGKPYDIWGVLGFVIGPSKDGRIDRGHWFCSEIAAARLAQFGIKPCGDIPVWEISPKMLVTEVLKRFDKTYCSVLTSIRNKLSWLYHQ